MFPTEFTYAAPATLAEAVQLMQGADAKPLAGGQSLLPLMKLRLASPGQLVDLRRIGELRGIREDGDAIIIGAMTTYLTALKSPVLARRAPLVVEAARVVGDMQVRARGTIGGSLAHADPGGDMPAVMLALNADVAAAGPSGTRVIPVTSLFTGMMETAIQPNELLTAIRFQAIDTPDTGSAYAKHHHPASGYAVVGVAAIVRLGPDGACQEARLAITGAGENAARAASVEQALVGKSLDEATISQAAASAANGLTLLSDSYASADYRAHLAQVYTRRALAMAAQRARGGA
ncbi:MAG TPA: xanthine dehydrogenase family protein subunit M [Ktedonobacterales bacterium]|jgi:carbon-monoxide dehydrogenase medium subunit